MNLRNQIRDARISFEYSSYTKRTETVGILEVKLRQNDLSIGFRRDAG